MLASTGKMHRGGFRSSIGISGVADDGHVDWNSQTEIFQRVGIPDCGDLRVKRMGGTRFMAEAGHDQSIAELLDRARAGDAAARERLFASCRAYVRLVARAQVETWLRAKVDASDLVQQTMMDAHRGFGDFRGGTEAEWLAWLRRILQHNAIDFVRRYRCTDKRQAKREVPIVSGNRDDSRVRGIEPSDQGESPSEAILRHERELEVAEAISRLSPDHQEVILLRNLQRLPFDEIGERMGRSRPAVQMLWMRALKNLEEMLRSRS